MLTSGSNQYLRPDYLSPLPTTLDAKKSPLALLAQTCSNIGADTPNTKPLIPPVEKPKEPIEKPREKTSPQSEDKSSFKPYESIKKEDSTESGDKSGFRTPTSKSASPAVSVASSNGKATPTAGTESSGSSASKTTDTTTVTSSSGSSSNPLSSVTSSLHNRISIGCGNMFVEVNHHESGLPKDSPLSTHLPLGAYKALPGLPPSLNPLSNCTGCTQVVGGHMPVDSSSFPPGLQNGTALKPTGFPTAGSTLSPYVAYARVKTAAGGTTLVPICRDPYCTNCQLSVQSAQLVGATCPSGCTQCNHEKAAAAAGLGVPGASHLSSLSLVPGLSVSSASTPVTSGLPLGSQFYSHSVLQHRPYVCNWIAGDTYCGKRFSTSEELLQHLRTHTNLSASDATGLSLLNPALSLPSTLACHLHYSTAPSFTTAAGLHRTYPTSLSPVSSLSSRYHPYKPPLPPLPGAPITPLAPHPGLGPYYSPYAMYGQRIGAAVHP